MIFSGQFCAFTERS